MRERRDAGRCYTFVGDILIALDPAAADEKNRALVELETLQRGEPHIFSLTRFYHLIHLFLLPLPFLLRSVYHKMLHQQRDQTIICHGHQQGGGKEKLMGSALNYLLHLGAVEGRAQSAANKLLAGDWILRKLALNSNRLTHVSFNRSGQMTGGAFDFSWLPLKTGFAETWKSCPVVHWLVAGLRSKGKVRELGLHLLLEEGDMAPPEENHVEQFRTFVKHLKTVGFREDLGMKVVFKVLVSEVLLLRLKEKIEKVEEVEEESTCQALLQAVASNLEVDPGLLWRSLKEETPLGGE